MKHLGDITNNQKVIGSALIAGSLSDEKGL